MDGVLGKFQKSTHLVFDEKPMPKAVLFQVVNKFVRHEKGPNQYGPGPHQARGYVSGGWLSKVALEQAGESLAVAGLVASHLVHGVVDGIEASGLGALSKIGLAGGGAVLGSTRISRFFLVESVTTSPRSSANLAACSASSWAAFSQYRPISG